MVVFSKFAREARLIIGGASIVASVDPFDKSKPSLLRFSFAVKKSLSENPNTCELVLYNLSESSRSALQESGAEVSLEAGYKDNSQLIFKGTISKTSHIHEGADWLSKVSLGDGEKAIRQADVSVSFAADFSVKDAVLAVAKELKLSLGNLSKQDFVKDGKASFKAGFVADGKAAKVFDQLVKGSGLKWSVQDGALLVHKPGEFALVPALSLTSDDLIGSPETGEIEDKDTKKKRPVFRGKTLLEPGIKPGVLIAMASKTLKGTYGIETVEHVGDTWGNDWFTSFEMVTA